MKFDIINIIVKDHCNQQPLIELITLNFGFEVRSTEELLTIYGQQSTLTNHSPNTPFQHFKLKTHFSALKAENSLFST